MTMFNRSLLVACGLLAAAFAFPAKAEQSPCATPIVTTMAGKLCGASLEKTDAYLGIPYAESTAGERRWTAPTPKAAWTGVRAATQFGPVCPQSLPGLEQSEDCLSLNVWTPKGARPAYGRAVMVFIHGGAFYVGSSADAMINGATLAAQGDVVVVALNYRLGALGFLATRELNGNYGFLDQQLALQWVQKNIRAFGGDPAKVTLFGESAGAMSVGLHMFSAPKSAPLFRAAIMESNFLSLPYKDRDEGGDAGDVFKQGMNCRDVACLRRADVKSILAAQNAYTPEMSTVFSGEEFYMPIAPVIDGRILTRQPMSASSVRSSRKPFVIGTNRDETTFFYAGRKMPPMRYAAQAASLFGSRFEAVIDKFPPKDQSADNWKTWSTAMTQYLLHCSSRRLALKTKAPAYVYLFDHQPSFPVVGGPACQSDGRVCHVAEVPFVFGTAEGLRGRFTPAEAKLSGAMISYWSNFAKTLDPNTAGASDLTKWPRFDEKHRAYLQLDAPKSAAVDDPFAKDCAFWETIGFAKPTVWRSNNAATQEQN